MATGDIGKRVRIAREAMPGNVRIADLARILGISHGRLSNWERGKHDPSSEDLPKIAEAMDISLDWLIGEPVPMRALDRNKEKPVYREGIRHIPIYGAISAGNPSCSQADVIEWFAMMDWGNDFKRWGRIISGFSMDPDLQPGWFAIFEDRQAESGHIVHAFDDGEDTVKQYRLDQDRNPLLVPTNVEYEILDGKRWNIKGVCIAVVYKDVDGATVLKEYAFGMRPRNPRSIGGQVS
jgi:transcriptional regulator with XRE-family HTH domain